MNISSFVFKCLNKLCIPQFHSWFIQTSQIHNHNTRAALSNNLYIPPVRTTFYGLKSIKVLGPKIWNNLPMEIKNNKSYISFLNNLKHHLLK